MRSIPGGPRLSTTQLGAPPPPAAVDGDSSWAQGTPWAAVTAALVAGVPALSDEVAVMLRPVAPEYAEFVDTRCGGVADAAEAAMVTLVEHTQRCRAAADDPDSPDGPSPSLITLPESVLSLFDGVGRAQWTARVALRTLIAPYQVGGRAAWHHVSDTALGAGVQPADLAALARRCSPSSRS